MKAKLLFIILLLLCFSISYGQKQRMAILPMEYENNNTLKAIGIDYFRERPLSGDSYRKFLSDNNESRLWIHNNYSIEATDDYTEMRLKDRNGKIITPSRQKSTIFIGQKNEPVYPRYAQFINNVVQEFNSDNFNKFHHTRLQDKIWTYNILDVLGYLENAGDVGIDLKNGLRRFDKEWGKVSMADIQLAASALKDIHQSNISDGEAFKTVLITKSDSNEYIVFDHPGRPIFRTRNELNMAKFISRKYDDNENIYIDLRNFENEKKSQAFLSTLRFHLMTKDKKITINKFLPEYYLNYILFSSEFNHKLAIPISEETIENKSINGKEYFSFKFEIISQDDDHVFPDEDTFKYLNRRTKIEVVSSKREILVSFIFEINSYLKDFTCGISFARYFNNLKKSLKLKNDIRDDTEFMMFIVEEHNNFRIIKVSGDNTIYFAMD